MKLSIRSGFMCEVCYSHHLGSDAYPSRFYFNKTVMEDFMKTHAPEGEKYGVDTVECELWFEEVAEGKRCYAEKFALVAEDGVFVELHRLPSDSRMEVWVVGDVKALADDPSTHLGERLMRRKDRMEKRK